MWCIELCVHQTCIDTTTFFSGKRKLKALQHTSVQSWFGIRWISFQTSMGVWNNAWYVLHIYTNSILLQTFSNQNWNFPQEFLHITWLFPEETPQKISKNLRAFSSPWFCWPGGFFFARTRHVGRENIHATLLESPWIALEKLKSCPDRMM